MIHALYFAAVLHYIFILYKYIKHLVLHIKKQTKKLCDQFFHFWNSSFVLNINF